VQAPWHTPNFRKTNFSVGGNTGVAGSDLGPVEGSSHGLIDLID
jgi:hypothetical protein